MLIGVMTSIRDDQPLGIYSTFQGERSAGPVRDKPLWCYHQQKLNIWHSHKPQEKLYGLELYWLSLITIRNMLQPYLRTINQQLHSPRILFIMRNQNILIYSIIIFARRSNLKRSTLIICR